MFTRTRIWALLAVLTPVVVCLGAEGGGTATAPDHHVGFFESHYILTELLVLPIFALLLAVAMASNTRTETIRTDHWDFWRKPLGSSYTQIQVPTEPSSPQEIKTTLKVLGVIYLALRFTCLFGFFNLTYQLIGSIIDIAVR